MAAFSERWDRVRFLWRGVGWRSALRRILQKVIAPIYRYEQAFLALQFEEDINGSDPEVRRGDIWGTETIVIDSPEDIEPYRQDRADLVPLDTLRAYLSERPGRVVVLARRPDAVSGGHRIVAYARFWRGMFSAWDGALEHAMPQDFMLYAHNWVHPECRGQRLQKFMRQAINDYCRDRGVRRTCGVIAAHNLPSLQSHRNLGGGASNTLAGPIVWKRFLGGAYETGTPWSEIETLIENGGR